MSMVESAPLSGRRTTTFYNINEQSRSRFLVGFCCLQNGATKIVDRLLFNGGMAPPFDGSLIVVFLLKYYFRVHARIKKPLASRDLPSANSRNIVVLLLKNYFLSQNLRWWLRMEKKPPSANSRKKVVFLLKNYFFSYPKFFVFGCV